MCISNILNWLSITANAYLVIAIVSPVIAVCALFATIYNARVARKHNKLSVKPHLALASGFDFNQQIFYIKMLNNGIGPALITKVQLFVDDKEIDAQNIEAIRDVISTLFHLYAYKQDISIITNTYMMRVNEEKPLIKVELTDSIGGFPINDDSEIQEILKRIDVKIEYESMYGEKLERFKD